MSSSAPANIPADLKKPDFDPFGPEHRVRFEEVPAEAIRWLIRMHEKHGVLKSQHAIMLKLALTDPSVLRMEVFAECLETMTACERKYTSFQTAFANRGYISGGKKSNSYALLPNTKETEWMRAAFERYGHWPLTKTEHAEFTAKVDSKEWSTQCNGATTASSADDFLFREMLRLVEQKRDAEAMLEKKRKRTDDKAAAGKGAADKGSKAGTKNVSPPNAGF